MVVVVVGDSLATSRLVAEVDRRRQRTPGSVRILPEFCQFCPRSIASEGDCRASTASLVMLGSLEKAAAIVGALIAAGLRADVRPITALSEQVFSMATSRTRDHNAGVTVRISWCGSMPVILTVCQDIMIP